MLCSSAVLIIRTDQDFDKGFVDKPYLQTVSESTKGYSRTSDQVKDAGVKAHSLLSIMINSMLHPLQRYPMRVLEETLRSKTRASPVHIPSPERQRFF